MISQHHPNLANMKALARRYRPAGILLDVMLPGMDGFDLVCELQADAMPLIIFVTAFDQYAIDAFRVHAVDYILKPIDDERLAEAVARALERHAGNTQGSKENLMALVTGRDARSAARDLVMNDSPSKGWPERLTIKDGNGTWVPGYGWMS